MVIADDITTLALARYVARNLELRAFLLRLLDPEDLGHAVSQEVRDNAAKLLKIPANEPRPTP